MTKQYPTPSSNTQADEQLFREFYYKMYPRVIAYLQKALKTDSYAEDIAQETFIRFWKSNIRSADPGLDIEAYFFTILRNSIATYFKKLLKEQSVLLQEQPAGSDIAVSPEVEDLINYKTSLAQYESALAAIGSEKERCFRMHREQGLTYRQIAQQEGLSERTVKFYISDTLKMLRKALPACSILFF